MSARFTLTVDTLLGPMEVWPWGDTLYVRIGHPGTVGCIGGMFQRESKGHSFDAGRFHVTTKADIPSDDEPLDEFRSKIIKAAAKDRLRHCSARWT